MKKWIAGVAAAVIAGIIVFWLTQGFHKKPEPESSLTKQSIHISGDVIAGRDANLIFNPSENHSKEKSGKEQKEPSQIT